MPTLKIKSKWQKTEHEEHEDASEVGPPGVRDRVDPVAVDVLRGVFLEVAGGREVAGKVADAPGQDGGAEEAGGDDEHGLLELERQHAAEDAEHDAQHDEHDLRVARVDLVANRVVDHHGESHASRGAGDEDAERVERHDDAAADEAAHHEGDPGGRDHPRLVIEDVLHHHDDHDAAGHEAHGEERDAEEAVAHDHHHGAGRNGRDGQDAAAHLDALSGVEERLDRVAGRVCGAGQQRQLAEHE
ncbi:unnamed protein product [Phytophthora fragariaefolia]|uniref:Unnamed protein product n=1 Tax=Phytophthora fragariaefolia TaxID=1490495 RepID=A0A9W7CIG8_9STRA|nr:unnamed protein product [Phytophthora fragariaefolia]